MVHQALAINPSPVGESAIRIVASDERRLADQLVVEERSRDSFQPKDGS